MDREPMKQCMHIGEILSNLMNQYRRDKGSELDRICESWERAVGDQIAKSAQPCAFKNGQLFVNVDNSIWLQQLQFLKKDIVAKVNQALGAEWVRDIKLKIGRLA